MKKEALAGAAVALASATWLALGSPAVEAELWQLVCHTGTALLAIGLVRDVTIKLAHRAPAPRRAGEKLICFESLAGALLVAAGLALLALDVHRAFHPTLAALGLWLAALLVASGETKDLVLVFRREKDHLNLIPW